jgi:hypothetical protein
LKMFVRYVLASFLEIVLQSCRQPLICAVFCPEVHSRALGSTIASKRKTPAATNQECQQDRNRTHVVLEETFDATEISLAVG